LARRSVFLHARQPIAPDAGRLAADREIADARPLTTQDGGHVQEIDPLTREQAPE
jgi:hypothetical protein